jgi:hypothetical protein
VNFVLHHHLAARDLGSAAAGAGAMLPDLWRIADRRVRAQREPRDAGADASPALTAAMAGITHHLEVDRWFHADAVFVEGERDATARLIAARLAAPRSVLFAHVLWELCLDGALLRRDGVETVLRAVRAGIVALGPEAPARAAALHHFDRIPRTDVERELFATRMARILEEVARGPWIAGYASGDGIAARIQGVRRGLGLAPMDAGDLTRLAEVAEALLELATAELARLEASRVRAS